MMIKEIQDPSIFIQNPWIGSIVFLITLGFTFYKSFQLIKKENFSFHKDRIDLIEKFICFVSSTNHHERILAEELFQVLWGSNKVRFDEIIFLVKLSSPKYFISLYIKAKGFVEIDNNEIKVTKKYKRHIDQLNKEEKKIERSYYFFAVVFSFTLSSSMFLNRPESFSDLFIIIVFLSICMIGMLFALLEVVKVYSAQRIIDEWKK